MGSSAEKQNDVDSQNFDNSLVISMVRETYPRVIDAGDAFLRPIQHQEGSQVGSVGCYNYHSEAGPHHSQDSC